MCVLMLWQRTPAEQGEREAPTFLGEGVYPSPRKVVAPSLTPEDYNPLLEGLKPARAFASGGMADEGSEYSCAN